ncbi:hypothetical protein SpCBS45565_g08002 [Spizellomyces sp. 'palustris']|nr:hypothetical protein SpCBS45565_g08002 [Spizellomyces sp. 'palustris']
MSNSGDPLPIERIPQTNTDVHTTGTTARHNSNYSSDTDHIFDSDEDVQIPEADLNPGRPATAPDGDIDVDDDLSDFSEHGNNNQENGHKSEDDDYVQGESEPEHDEIVTEGESSADDKPSGRNRKRTVRSSKSEFSYAEENPDLYGLRRSGRARTQPNRFTAAGKEGSASDDEEDDDDYGSRRKKQRKGKLRSRAQMNRRKDDPDDFIGDFSEEEEVSGSDFESENAKKKRQKQNLYQWDDDFPRYSTRQRNPALDYNENAADEDLDLEERGPEIYSEAYQPEEEGDVIDGFFDQRTVEVGDENGNVVEQSQYLVKWLGRSYRELQWCDVKYLETLKGFKKIDKFIKEFNERQAILEDPYLTEEDRERVLMEINDKKDLLEEHKKVDRIIASRVVSPDEDNPSGTQYYCKWRGLGYEEGTWESATSLADDQAEIDSFLDRSNSQQVPSRSEQYKPDHRPPYKPFRVADFVVGGELREFQLIGVNWMADLWHRNENGILADEMGLGKTVQTVSFLSYLFHIMKVYGPFLVVVPLGTISAWQREFARWAPDINVVLYQGNAKGRSIIREYEFYSYTAKKGRPAKRILRFNVLLTTYEMIIQDKAHLNKIKWAFLAVDEAHRLKNEDSKLHQSLAKEYMVANRLLITGTPLQNNVQELMALIQFLMPGASIDMDLEIDLDATDNEEQKGKIQYLHNLLTKLMLRRLKKDVETSLPGKTELILRVPMSELQKKYYTAIFTKNFAGLKNGSKDEVRISLQNVVMELKKASNHPFLFPNARSFTTSRNDSFVDILSSAGKMVLLDKLLTRMKAEGRRVLIFSQMVNMLNILAEYLTLRGLQFQRLDGTVQSEARKRAMDHFNAPGSTDFAFLLSTRAGGLGLNLETADTVILFDLDWNPQNDLQAIARAHRIGQKKHVNVYRFITAGSIEEDIIERAKRKMVLEYAIIQQMENNGQVFEKIEKEKQLSEELQRPTRDELATILKFGAKKLFEQDAAEHAGGSGETNDNKVEKLDLDDILARAEKTELAQAQPVAGGSDEFMERWKTMNVQMDQLEWNSLVPANDRDKVAEAEELLRESQPKVPAPRKRLPQISYAEGEGEEEETGTRKRSAKATKGKGKKGGQANQLDKKAIGDLANALMTWGNLDRRFDEIISHANLGDKSADAVKTHAREIMAACEEAVRVNEEAMQGQKTSKADKEKAIYADYKGTKDINAKKMIERIPLLNALTDEMESHKNQLSFRLEQTDLGFTGKWDSKPPWNTKDDAMLLVGVYRHGFGNWRAMQADVELGFAKKFHLGGERSSDQKDKLLPKKLHLDRRAMYLLKELQTRQNNIRLAREKTNSKKRARESAKSGNGAVRVKNSKSEAEPADKSPRPKKKSRTSDVAEKKDRAESDLFTNYDETKYKQMLRPVKEQMLRLRGPPAFEEDEPDVRERKQTQWKLDRAKNEFLAVCSLIEDYVAKERTPIKKQRIQAHLFRFIADNFFWTKADGTSEDWETLRKLWEIAHAGKEKGDEKEQQNGQHGDVKLESPAPASTKRKRGDRDGDTPTALSKRHSPLKEDLASENTPSTHRRKREREDVLSPSAAPPPKRHENGRNGILANLGEKYKIPKKQDIVKPRKSKSPSRSPSRSRSRSRSQSRSRDNSRRDRSWERDRKRERGRDERDRERDKGRERERGRGDRDRERKGDRYNPYRR